MATTRKTKAPKRAGAAKGGRGMGKKSKPPSARKKARPAAKAATRKPAAKKKAVKRPAKAAPRKAPAKARKAAKTTKAAPRKAAKKVVARKAPARKLPAKAAIKEPAVKTVAPPKEAPAPVAVTPEAAPRAAAPAAPRKAPVEPSAAPAAEAAAAPVVARPRRPRPVEARPAAPEAKAPAAEPGAAVEEAAPPGPAKAGGLPPIRPYRGTQGGKPGKAKAGRKKRSRDRYSTIFAEFETKPAAPERKKKRRTADEEDEDTSISVLRERPKLQIESPEQIRAGVLKKYLETGQPSCPVGCGGIAEVVRVGTLEDGAGEVWIECLSCAQRDRFMIPKASPAERQEAQHTMEEVGEAPCPRHGRLVHLRRRGRDLVCPDCGVLYPEG